ncbi:DUF7336 domain-containing protein [Cohnella rhizoplanae]
MIGIYSSLEKAKTVVSRYQRLPGFKDHADLFFIDAYEIDSDHWTEGFI